MNEVVPDRRGSRFEELKRRKIVQWALAYLAGAWLVIQLVDVIGGQFDAPPALTRGVTILLGFGFFLTLASPGTTASRAASG